MILELPEVLLSVISIFLNSDDQKELLNCCKQCKFGFFGTSLFSPEELISEVVPRNELREKLRHLKKGLDQVSFSIRNWILEKYREELIELMRICGCSFFAISGTIEELNSLCEIAPSAISVHRLLIIHKSKFRSNTVASDIAIYQSLSANLETKIRCLQHLSIGMSKTTVIIPFIPTLKRLSVIDSRANYPVPAAYFSQLEILEFAFCEGLSDVTLMGSIPTLVFQDCHAIVDISSLNNNKTIVVKDCQNVRDYSRSFLNSLKIRLLIAGNAIINFSAWKQVKYLSLFDDGRYIPGLTNRFMGNRSDSLIEFQGDNSLPITLRRCHLKGSFVDRINLHVSDEHQLEELKLENNSRIVSLANLGFEKLFRISCSSLLELKSLKGLGKGKNQHVEITNCPRIIDYSVLKHLPSVAISYSEFPSGKLNELSEVQSLVIRVRELKIPPSINLSKVQRLVILSDTHVHRYRCLERVAEIQFAVKNISVLEDFLREGGKLQHQKIEIILDPSRATDFSKLDELLRDEYFLYKRRNRIVCLRKEPI